VPFLVFPGNLAILAGEIFTGELGTEARSSITADQVLQSTNHNQFDLKKEKDDPCNP
jgi:hypothetical protein